MGETMRQKTVKENISYTKEPAARKKHLWLEAVFVLGCIVIGFLLRMYQLQLQDRFLMQGNTLFEKAMVLKDHTIPYMNNNLVYAYTYWMRGICSFVGNFAMNILVAQVIMEEIAILFIYFALRNLNMKDGAQFLMVVLQFLFYKGFVTDIVPECLLLFSIGSIGWVFSKYISYYKSPVQRKNFQYLKLILVSMLAAVPVYLDWIGCILPIFMIVVIIISPKNKKLQQCLLLLLGTLSGTAILFGAKAIANGKIFYEIGMEYYQNLQSFPVDTLFLCYFGTVVIAMLISKIVSIIRDITIGYKEKKIPQQNKEELGNAVIEKAVIEKKDINTKDIVQKDIEQKHSHQKIIEENEIERNEEAQIKIKQKELSKIDKVKPDEEEIPIKEERIGKKKIHFLDNPLPVPKKHVRKEMDYAIIPPDEMMEFDLELESGKEDFDI